MGLNFSKDLYLASEQIKPGSGEKVSKLQQKLIEKFGTNSIPFSFNIPANAPQSVVIQPGEDEAGQPCGVYYTIKVFINDDKEKPNKRYKAIRLIRIS